MRAIISIAFVILRVDEVLAIFERISRMCICGEGGRAPDVAGAPWRRDVGRYRTAAIEVSSRDFMLSGFHLKRLTAVKGSFSGTDQNGFADHRDGRSMADFRQHRKVDVVTDESVTAALATCDSSRAPCDRHASRHASSAACST
ncbi:hypothetical protein [Burkholderia cepacia]|uniref:hypothetical protein n=1 Tax=Burkholderia cepacia TaxID=292 RepID=UPI001651A9E9|nr:hypothetical protein [Burkholderia cepacia]